jgi:hypothetical protein
MELLLTKLPTAAQKLADVHDTRWSSLLRPVLFGLGAIPHAEPFQDSINV